MVEPQTKNIIWFKTEQLETKICTIKSAVSSLRFDFFQNTCFFTFGQIFILLQRINRIMKIT